MRSTEEELRRVAYDLREVVNGLAKVEDPYDITQYSGTDLRVTVKSPEQTRADAWLTIIEQLVRLQPGDSMTVDWHDPESHPHGHIATLTYKPDPTREGPVRFG